MFDKNAKNGAKIILLSILILAFSLRVQYLDKPLQGDETIFYETVKNLNDKKIPVFCENCVDEYGRTLSIFDYHSPLFLLYLSNVVSFFGLNEIAIRFSIVVFSVVTVFLTYLIGCEIGGEKLGLVASFLLAINRLHVEHSQIIDMDGSFLTFFITLNILFLIKWFKSDSKKYFILSIITLATSLLVKESAILIFIPLFFYLYKKGKTNEFLEIVTIALAILIIFIFIFDFYFSVDLFNGILKQLNRYMKTPTENRLYQFLGITTWNFTPPFILISLFSIFYNWNKNEYFIFLISIVIIFVLFFTAMLGITRYFVPIIPILCLLISNYIVRIKNGIKNISVVVFVVFLCFFGFYYLKIRTDINFLNNIKNNFPLIITPYALCLIPITLYFTGNKGLAITILIGMTVGYNLFFSQEAVNPSITPDYNKATREAAEFIKNFSTEKPIVTTNDIAFYSGKEYYEIEYVYYKKENPYLNKRSIETLIKENKVNYIVYKTNTVVIQSSLDEFLESNCKKIKNGFSNNVETFKAFQCLG